MKTELDLYNKIFTAMGVALFGVACWIAASVSHLPQIEQKLEDYIITTNQKFDNHETRIELLESKLK